MDRDVAGKPGNGVVMMREDVTTAKGASIGIETSISVDERADGTCVDRGP